MKTLDAFSKPNLTHIQSFYVVAKHGSLGAAVRAGGRSLATLGRHITALEKELSIADASVGAGITFSWAFDDTGTAGMSRASGGIKGSSLSLSANWTF